MWCVLLIVSTPRTSSPPRLKILKILIAAPKVSSAPAHRRDRCRDGCSGRLRRTVRVKGVRHTGVCRARRRTNATKFSGSIIVYTQMVFEDSGSSQTLTGLNCLGEHSVFLLSRRLRITSRLKSALTDRWGC